jgi:hypothetical protein
MRIPWAQQPPPEWVGKTPALTFEGGNTTVLGTYVLRQPATLSMELERLHEHVLLARVTSRATSGPGFPADQSTWDMACTPASLYPLWISPAALRDMKPNQLVDDDPITRFRITFMGIENGRAVVVEQGPLERNTYYFDVNRGIFLGFRGQRPYADGAGQFHTETWLQE